ncbi:GntP family permease [Teichococcus aestuarii]|uniref:GntP family permease n=1 Tax=Teichococcus aestuarii TaxID=568898 RepID=UPI0036168CCE
MNGAASTVGPAAIVGLVFGIALLIFLVLRTKIHAILALVIAASIAGLSAGMAPDAVVGSITKGFGATLSTIGLVIGFGVMMGRILEVTGAAERLAITFVRWLGEKKEEWAMMATGYIVSIPIFCDSAFVILNPLARALARNSGKSVLTMGIALAGGLMLTHHAVPPTPGPLGAAGIFGVDIGMMILWGIVLTLPATFVLIWYARAMGPRIEAMILRDTGEPLGGNAAAAFGQFKEAAAKRESELPSLTRSVLPILAPILLIFVNTVVTGIAKASGDPAMAQSTLVQLCAFIGNPVIAVGIGVALAAYGRPAT